MKRSLSVLGVLVIIVQLAIVFPSAAQTKTNSVGVTMTNVYDAFGKESKKKSKLITKRLMMVYRKSLEWFQCQIGHKSVKCFADRC